MLVEIASKLSEEDLNTSVFITSDKPLKDLLVNQGVNNIIGSGTFFKIFSEEFGDC